MYIKKRNAQGWGILIQNGDSWAPFKPTNHAICEGGQESALLLDILEGLCSLTFESCDFGACEDV